MKKKLLLVLAAGLAVVSANAGTLKQVKQTGKRLNQRNINMMRLDGEYALSSYNLNPNVAPSLASTTSSGLLVVEAGSSPNLYTALVSESHCLTANQELNMVMFNRRRNNTSFGNSGFVQASISTNGGVSFDSLLTVVGDSSDTHLCRYPNGAIVNPIGNTNPNNAFIVSSGPWHPGADWKGNFFGSVNANGANYDNYFVDNTALQTGEIKSDFARISAQSTDNEMYYTMGGQFTDANGTTWAAQDYQYAVLHAGKLNTTTNTFDWTSRAFPHTFRKDPTDLTKSVSSVAQTAWSQDGNVGYVFYMGEDSATFDSLKTYQPIVYKTTDGGQTWNFMSMFNFGTLSNLTSALRSTRQGTKRPFFSTQFGVGSTVDYNNELHIVSVISAASTDHPDSLEYTWNIPHIVADVHTTPTGWGAFVLDSLNTDVVSDTLSPWQASDNSGGNGWDARIQISRTKDGKRIFYGWMDTDTTWAVTTNEFPDIYAKGLNVENNTLTATKNFTANDNVLHGKINWMYMQYTTLKNSLGGYDLGFTTTQSYDGSNDALSAVKHYYIKGISFSDPEFNNVDCSSLKVDNITITYPSSTTTNNGALTANISGGVAPYTYSWNTSPAQTTQTASNLGVGTYYLTVSDSLGCVTNSSVSISLESVKSIDFTKAVQVYPNPTNGVVYLNISNELGNNASVQVTTIDGKVVYNATNMSTSTINKIDFSSLKSGLYFVKITSGNNSGVIKINKL